MSEDQILKILIDFKDYLQIKDTFSNILRSLGMLLIKGLVWLTDNLQDQFSHMLKLLNFYSEDSIIGGKNSILSLLEPIQSLLLGLAILVIGLVLYFGKSEEIRNVPINTFMIVCILFILPSLLSDAVNVTKAVFEDTTAKSGQLGFKTVKDNVTDIYVLGSNGWTSDKLKEKNNLSGLDFFDVNEIIEDPSEVDKDKVLEYKVRDKKSGEGYELVKMAEGDGLLDSLVKWIVGEYYYRWKVNFIPIICILIALVGAEILFLLRAGRLGFETAVNYIWTSLVAFASIRDLKRLKVAIRSLFTGLIVLASIIVMYYMFVEYTTFINGLNLPLVAKIFAYLGGLWAVFDGPAIIQQTLGIDAGLSTASSIVAGMGVGKAVGAVTNTAKKGVYGAAEAGGFVKGLYDGAKDNDDKSISDKLEKNSSESSSDEDANKSVHGKGDQEKNEKNNKENEQSNEEHDKEDKDEQTKKEEHKDDSQKLTSDVDENDHTEPKDDKNDKEGDVNKNVEDGEKGEESKDGTSNQSNEGEEKTTRDGEKGINKNFDSSEDSKEQEPINEKVDEKEEDKSKHDTDSKELPKPKNPFVKRFKEDASTPKHMKNNKNTIGNTLEHTQKGHALGKDLSRYMKDRKAYKEQQKEIKKNEKEGK